MFSIFPYVFTLVFWVIFFTGIHAPSTIPYAFLALVLWFAITVGLIGRKQFLQNGLRWLMVFLFLVSSFGLVLIVSSEGARNVVTIVTGLLAATLLIAMTTPRATDGSIARRYLELITFVHLITFWEVAALLFFGMASYDRSYWHTVWLVVPVTYVLALGIASVRSSSRSVSKLMLGVVTLTVAELMYALELLPVHFFVVATILTVWFFFVVELVSDSAELSNKKKRFSIYASLLLGCIALLLITAQWG